MSWGNTPNDNINAGMRQTRIFSDKMEKSHFQDINLSRLEDNEINED